MIKLQLAIDATSINLKKEDLTKLKVGLNNKSMDHKFIPLEQLHIPLLMIGEKEESEIDSISQKIESVLVNQEIFDLKISGVWAYPEQAEARLLYVGVQNAKELRSLQEQLSQSIFGNFDNEFKPNLPLVRLKNYRNVTDVISPYKTRDFGKLSVENLVLLQITSGGAYMTYKVLKQFPVSALKGEVTNEDICF
jgi:2'-5' RNA ligase